MRDNLRNLVQYTKFRLKEILFYGEYDAVEFIVGISAIMWGLWVGNPFWDAFVIAPHPHFLELAPEWIWGSAVAMVGGAHVTAVTIDTSKLRKWIAFISFCTWLFIFTTFGVQRILGPATSLYFVLTLTQAWVYLRFVRRNYIPLELAYKEGILDRPPATK